MTNARNDGAASSTMVHHDKDVGVGRGGSSNKRTPQSPASARQQTTGGGGHDDTAPPALAAARQKRKSKHQRKKESQHNDVVSHQQQGILHSDGQSDGPSTGPKTDHSDNTRAPLEPAIAASHGFTSTDDASMKIEEGKCSVGARRQHHGKHRKWRKHFQKHHNRNDAHNNSLTKIEVSPIAEAPVSSVDERKHVKKDNASLPTTGTSDTVVSRNLDPEPQGQTEEVRDTKTDQASQGTADHSIASTQVAKDETTQGVVYSTSDRKKLHKQKGLKKNKWHQKRKSKKGVDPEASIQQDHGLCVPQPSLKHNETPQARQASVSHPEMCLSACSLSSVVSPNVPTNAEKAAIMKSPTDRHFDRSYSCACSCSSASSTCSICAPCTAGTATTQASTVSAGRTVSTSTRETDTRFDHLNQQRMPAAFDSPVEAVSASAPATPQMPPFDMGTTPYAFERPLLFPGMYQYAVYTGGPVYPSPVQYQGTGLGYMEPNGNLYYNQGYVAMDKNGAPYVYYGMYGNGASTFLPTQTTPGSSKSGGGKKVAWNVNAPAFEPKQRH